MRIHALWVLAALLAGACAPAARQAAPPSECPAAACPPCPRCPGVEAPPAPPPPAKPLKPAQWEDLPGWQDDDLRPSLSAFMESCRATRAKPEWRAVCAEARGLARDDATAARRFFQSRFNPYQVVNPDGGVEGLVTGYYEPFLKGSRTRSSAFPYGVYAVPDDLLVIDLAELHPQLKDMRLRGRVEGRRIVPYYSRAELVEREPSLAGKALAWVADPVDLFFLHVQGSGRIDLPDGKQLRVGYADQNGHPYRSIGRWLVDQGELSADEASMEGIKEWGRRKPERLAELLNVNPSYVFFRELPAGPEGPVGSLGVPLTPGRSVAVDPKAVPLGAPVWLATTWPRSQRPLVRLMQAQDTGGAIRGPVRADFFWGPGPEAGANAGSMRQQGRMWVLLPEGHALP